MQNLWNMMYAFFTFHLCQISRIYYIIFVVCIYNINLIFNLIFFLYKMYRFENKMFKMMLQVHFIYRFQINVGKNADEIIFFICGILHSKWNIKRANFSSWYEDVFKILWHCKKKLDGSHISKGKNTEVVLISTLIKPLIENSVILEQAR